MSGEAPAFGIVAPMRDGVVMFLRGAVWCTITEGGSTREVSGEQALTWVDQIVPGTFERLAIGGVSGRPVQADPLSDLRDGVVPGQGFVLSRTAGIPGPDPARAASALASVRAWPGLPAAAGAGYAGAGLVAAGRLALATPRLPAMRSWSRLGWSVRLASVRLARRGLGERPAEAGFGGRGFGGTGYADAGAGYAEAVADSPERVRRRPGSRLGRASPGPRVSSGGSGRGAAGFSGPEAEDDPTRRRPAGPAASPGHAPRRCQARWRTSR